MANRLHLFTFIRQTQKSRLLKLVGGLQKLTEVSITSNSDLSAALK